MDDYNVCLFVVLVVCDDSTSFEIYYSTMPSASTKIKSSLTFGRMFKAAINDSAGQLRLEHEISEIAGMDADIMSPNFRIHTIANAICLDKFLSVMEGSSTTYSSSGKPKIPSQV